MPLPVSTARCALIAALAALSLALGIAPGSSMAAPSPAGDVTSPSSFELDYESRLASDGDHLWLATTGKDSSGKFNSQIQTYQDGSWKSLPGRPRTGTDYPLQMAAWKVPGSGRIVPCLGDTRGIGGRVRCLQNGSWTMKDLPGEFDGMNLAGLKAEGSKLTALFVEWERKPILSTIRLARLDGDRFVPLGPALDYEGRQVQATLGQETATSTEAGIDIALQQVSGEGSGDRAAAHYEKSRWAISPLPAGLVAGPHLSGPVRSKNGLYFPVSEAEYTGDQAGKPWPMSVFASRGGSWSKVGGKPASNGQGSAQGGIDPVGDDIWATWSQSGGQVGNRISKDKQFAVKLKQNGSGFEKRIVLWSGEPLGPGINQTVEFKGEPVFLYMRTLKGSTRATVDFSH